MISLLRSASVGAVLLLALSVAARGDDPVDVILEWNAIALESNAIDHTAPDVPADQLSSTQGPPASARVLAIVHAAMFDAYNSVDRRYRPYRQHVGWAFGASADAAVAQAAHDTLVVLYPAQRERLDAALQETLSRVPSRWSKLHGRLVGFVVAMGILFERWNDGSDFAGTYTPTGEPGNHDVDPQHPEQGFIGPNFGSVTPFTVRDITQFRAPTPPSLTSLEYAFALEEVSRLGGDDITTPSDRTADETEIALYWSYNGSPLIGTPPRVYNQIARLIAQQQGNDVHENARLFALLNLALADAGISAWDSKYTYAYWRPILGIRQADLDGNPDTDAFQDPTWTPLGGSRSNPFPGESNFTPAFPSYTSGHATFGAAAFKTLANFYQTDDIPFSFISDEWNGVTTDQFGVVRPVRERFFFTLSQAAAENAASRVFNGVHWRFDGAEGVRAGNAIADHVYENLLRPRGRPPQAIPDADFEAQIDAYLTGGF